MDDDDNKPRQEPSPSGSDNDDNANNPSAVSAKPKADSTEELPKMKHPGVFITETNDRDGTLLPVGLLHLPLLLDLTKVA